MYFCFVYVCLLKELVKYLQKKKTRIKQTIHFPNFSFLFYAFLHLTTETQVHDYCG